MTPNVMSGDRQNYLQKDSENSKRYLNTVSMKSKKERRESSSRLAMSKSNREFLL